MKVSELKELKGVKTSEEAFGLPYQPENQCPLVDEIISITQEEANNVKVAHKDISYTHPDNTSLSTLDWASYNMFGVESELEKLRANISNIREWGQYWKDLAIEALEGKTKIEDFK